jgi:uncharacterized oxidoreductase
MQTIGNTILITGGGTGIGRGLAEAFHAAGNQVIIAGRRRAVLDDVARANPGMAVATVDMAEATSITALAASVAETHPALNVVIHNAGVMLVEDLTAHDYASKDAEAMIATNLIGPIRLTAALLPQLKTQLRASIVTVSSGLAFVPLVITPTYNATKAALHSWTQALRSQLVGTTIDVLEIVPPGVATDLMPGHAENPASMPLGDYIAEVMALIAADPAAHEICVERVGFLRTAERSGQYDAVYAMLNQAS